MFTVRSRRPDSLLADDGSRGCSCPFSIHGGRFYDGHGNEIDDLLKTLPVTVLVLAAQDMALESDPDQPAEGDAPPAAEIEPAEPAKPA